LTAFDNPRCYFVATFKPWEFSVAAKAKQTLAKTMKLKWLKLEASSLNDLNLMLEEIKSEA